MQQQIPPPLSRRDDDGLAVVYLVFTKFMSELSHRTLIDYDMDMDE